MDNINVIYMHIDLGFIVDIIKTIKIEFYGRDKVVNHFHFNSILTLKENFSKSTLKLQEKFRKKKIGNDMAADVA